MTCKKVWAGPYEEPAPPSLNGMSFKKSRPTIRTSTKCRAPETVFIKEAVVARAKQVRGALPTHRLQRMRVTKSIAEGMRYNPNRFNSNGTPKATNATGVSTAAENFACAQDLQAFSAQDGKPQAIKFRANTSSERTTSAAS